MYYARQGAPPATRARSAATLLARSPATLNSYDRLFHNYERHFGLIRASITDLATQIAPLIGDDDPAVRANLLAAEHQARIVLDNLDNLDKLRVEWDKTLNKSFKGFRIQAFRWFDSKADRKRFLRQADLMDVSFRYLLTIGVFPRLSQAALILSNDPPDMDVVSRKIAEQPPRPKRHTRISMRLWQRCGS